MNNIVSDATVCDLFGEARFPALIMHCLQRGEERARAGERNRERGRERASPNRSRKYNYLLISFR